MAFQLPEEGVDESFMPLDEVLLKHIQNLYMPPEYDDYGRTSQNTAENLSIIERYYPPREVHRSIEQVFPQPIDILRSAYFYYKKRIHKMSDIPDFAAVPQRILNGWVNENEERNDWNPDEPEDRESSDPNILIHRPFIPRLDHPFMPATDENGQPLQTIGEAYQNEAVQLTGNIGNPDVNPDQLQSDMNKAVNLGHVFSHLNEEEARLFIITCLYRIYLPLKELVDNKEKSNLAAHFTQITGITLTGADFSMDFIDFLNVIMGRILLIALEWSQTLEEPLNWGAQEVGPLDEVSQEHNRSLMRSSRQTARGYRPSPPEELSRGGQMNQVLTPYLSEQMDDIRARVDQFEALMPSPRDIILKYEGFMNEIELKPIRIPQEFEAMEVDPQRGHIWRPYRENAMSKEVFTDMVKLKDDLNVVAFIVALQEAAFDLESILSEREEGGLPNAVERLNQEEGYRIYVTKELKEYLKDFIRGYNDAAYHWTMHLQQRSPQQQSPTHTSPRSRSRSRSSSLGLSVSSEGLPSSWEGTPKSKKRSPHRPDQSIDLGEIPALGSPISSIGSGGTVRLGQGSPNRPLSPQGEVNDFGVSDQENSPPPRTKRNLSPWSSSSRSPPGTPKRFRSESRSPPRSRTPSPRNRRNLSPWSGSSRSPPGTPKRFRSGSRSPSGSSPVSSSSPPSPPGSFNYLTSRSPTPPQFSPVPPGTPNNYTPPGSPPVPKVKTPSPPRSSTHSTPASTGLTSFTGSSGSRSRSTSRSRTSSESSSSSGSSIGSSSNSSGGNTSSSGSSSSNSSGGNTSSSGSSSSNSRKGYVRSSPVSSGSSSD